MKKKPVSVCIFVLEDLHILYFFLTKKEDFFCGNNNTDFLLSKESDDAE